MKGYRTIFLAAVAVALGVLGRHLFPDTISAYADVIIVGLGLAFGGLRLITDTPFGQRVVADVEAVAHNVEKVPEEIVAKLRAELVGTASVATPVVAPTIVQQPSPVPAAPPVAAVPQPAVTAPEPVPMLVATAIPLAPVPPAT